MADTGAGPEHRDAAAPSSPGSLVDHDASHQNSLIGRLTNARCADKTRGPGLVTMPCTSNTSTSGATEHRRLPEETLDAKPPW